jgi:hypothetical protein
VWKQKKITMFSRGGAGTAATAVEKRVLNMGIAAGMGPQPLAF